MTAGVAGGATHGALGLGIVLLRRREL
jgi:hypothetical protein